MKRGLKKPKVGSLIFEWIKMQTNKDNLFKGANSKNFEFARELRQRQTEEENIVWGYLRNKKLGVKFRRQHPIANYIADFYCHEAKLILEIDGEIYNSISQIDYDIKRTAHLNDYGITVLRFTNHQIITDLLNVLETVKDFIRNN